MKILFWLATLSTPAWAGDNPGAGVANPAAQFCADLGGTLESHESSENCVIEEWALYRAMSAKNLVKPDKCDQSHGPCMANPASVNCGQIGGTVRITRTPDGEGGNCVVDEWKLFRVFH